MYLNKPLNNMVQPQHHRSLPAGKKQQGSALVIAVFVILLMSALILFLAGQLFSSSVAVSFEVQGNRAFNAAQSGLQAGLVRLFPLNSNANCAAVNAAPVINFDANGALTTVPGLAGCSATLTCLEVPNPDNAGRPLFRLQSSGICIAGDVKTSRVVQMEAY